MMNDEEFIKAFEELQRSANSLKNEFRSYNFRDYIETEYDSKNLRAKARVFYDMIDRLVNDKIAMFDLATEAINFRRQFIKQIGENPHVKERWDEIMTTLAILN